MNSKTKVLIASGLLIAMTSVAQAKDVATVNGKGISENDYKNFLKYRLNKKANGSVGANRQQVINELVSRELVYQDAVKQGITKDEAFKYQLEQLRIDATIQAAVKKKLSANPITELELKNEYDTRIKGANVQEYKASHILVKTEDEAKAIIKELNGGAAFADVAKAKSTGPSGKNGGDLGWFNPSQMVPPFSQAVVKMKNGEISKTPVQTQFGWHVIKRVDNRKVEPPKFADVKKQLQQILQNKRIQAYMLELRKNSKIKINE
ncbi:MAG: peptidylprolyl isomerase [Gammaproteobacteria bacterium]